MNKKCEFCNTTQEENKYTKTIDGQDICLGCYNEATDYYHKGVINSEEVKAYKELTNKYKEEVTKLALTIKKQAKHNNEDPKNILKEVKELEEGIALASFKKGKGFHKTTIKPTTETFKGRIPLTIDEQYLIVKQTNNNFDLIRPELKENVRVELTNGGFEQEIYNHYFKPFKTISFIKG